MKKVFIVLILGLIIARPCPARDFMVEFVEENYKETRAEFSYSPLIYHSIQVNSSAGSKILILTGNDYNYRKWLRQYIAQGKKFIAKIPDDRVDEFVSSQAFSMDVRSLHPFDGQKWEKNVPVPGDENLLKGDNYILIVDPDEKRTELINTIVKKMGYQTMIFKTGNQALDLFKLQPASFKMIIIHHAIQGMSSDYFVDQILKLSHRIPVLVDTGYKNQNMEKKLILKFSNFTSVHVKPVVLRDLPQTIETLIKKNA